MDIIGHKKQLAILEKAMQKDALSQAYVFTGPKQVGKFTLALNFAKKLTGKKEGIDADLRIITPEIEEKTSRKKDIKIEKIRELQHWLSLSPASGQKRVAIIDDADRLNVMAQNALLKTLEEPNPNCMLILIVQNNQKILPTIFSRCQRINFGTISNRELEKYMADQDGREEQLIFWSLGRPGILIEMLGNPAELARRQEIFNDLNHLFGQNIDARFTLAEKMTKDIDGTMGEMDLWTIILRESLLSGGFKLKKTPDEKINLIEKIESSLALIKETNANTRLILENLFLNF